MSKRMNVVLCILWALSLSVSAAVMRPAIPYFPDTAEYKTLVCDFHTHTVFSDGQVWPTVRVDEAWREGLDAIALTDHIEYQPHKEDIPTQHDRPYAISAGRADETNILLIKGSEITKDTPPGHYNALFVSDIDAIFDPDVLKATQNAAKQKAFVFWNHHTWKGEARGQWEQTQTTMLENKWLHGMEVANGKTYYPLAHQWCLDKGLTMMGDSDIHVPSIDAVYTPDEHRTLTLVLTAERSTEAVKDALKAGRTIVWHGNRLIGRTEHLMPLYEASVSIHPRSKGQTTFIEIINRAFVDLDCQRVGKVGPASFTVPARSTYILKVPLPQEPDAKPLTYTVANWLVAPDKGLPIRIAR